MKRICIFMLCLVFCMTFVLSAIPTVGAESVILVDENFDDGVDHTAPEGTPNLLDWQINETGGTVTFVPDATGGKCLQFSKDANTALTAFALPYTYKEETVSYYEFDADPVVVLEADISCTAPKGGMAIHYHVWTGETSPKFFTFMMGPSTEGDKSGQIPSGFTLQKVGGGYEQCVAQSLKSFKLGQVYKLKFVLDYQTQTFDFYVDGMLAKENHPFLTDDESALGLQSIRFATQPSVSGYTGTIDNVKLYTTDTADVDTSAVTAASVTYAEDDSPVTALKANGTIEANVTVHSVTNSASLVAVLYDDNRAVDIKIAPLDFSAGSDATSATLTTQLPADVTGCQYKLFVVDSFNTITPVAFPAEYQQYNTGITAE